MYNGKDMRRTIKRAILAVALLVMAAVSGHAQNSAEVEKKVEEVVTKYDGTEGVNCFTVTKGNGLEMIKLMLNKEFGKDFMKGVRSITIIDYGEASEAICQSVRNEINEFVTLLEEFKVDEEDQFADKEYIRSFAYASDDNTISDFVIVIEDGKNKMFMYMAGDIKVE